MSKAEFLVLVYYVIPDTDTTATLRLHADRMGTGWEQPVGVNVRKQIFQNNLQNKLFW